MSSESVQRNAATHFKRVTEAYELLVDGGLCRGQGSAAARAQGCTPWALHREKEALLQPTHWLLLPRMQTRGGVRTCMLGTAARAQRSTAASTRTPPTRASLRAQLAEPTRATGSGSGGGGTLVSAVQCCAERPHKAT